MTPLFSFVLQTTLISLSGVMSPGPMTAVTIIQANTSRHTGAWIAVGHGIVEFPLMFLIILGTGTLLNLSWIKGTIGLAGGVVLIWMSVSMFRDFWQGTTIEPVNRYNKPILTGIMLSAGNPYFLLWWATVGLNLVIQSANLGVWAFGIFAVVHWLCDLVWLEILSLASHRGLSALGKNGQRIISLICSVVLCFFGFKFLLDGITFLN